MSFELKSGLFKKKKNPKTGLSNIYSQISLRSIEKGPLLATIHTHTSGAFLFAERKCH